LLDRQEPLEARRATLTRVSATDRDCGPGGSLDEVVVTYFPAPHSYTGEHVVEISAHGSPVVLQAIVASAMGAGARLARPGEFTLRAFLNGKRDLVQAEAVADLVAAATPLQARVAFDQLEGTLTGRISLAYSLITEAQWHLSRRVFIRFNQEIGLTSRATDWEPQLGILITLPTRRSSRK